MSHRSVVFIEFENTQLAAGGYAIGVGAVFAQLDGKGFGEITAEYNGALFADVDDDVIGPDASESSVQAANRIHNDLLQPLRSIDIVIVHDAEAHAGEIRALSGELTNKQWYCTYRQWPWPGDAQRTLETLAQQFDVEWPADHDALSAARLLASLLMRRTGKTQRSMTYLARLLKRKRRLISLSAIPETTRTPTPKTKVSSEIGAVLLTHDTQPAQSEIQGLLPCITTDGSTALVAAASLRTLLPNTAMHETTEDNVSAEIADTVADYLQKVLGAPTREVDESMPTSDAHFPLTAVTGGDSIPTDGLPLSDPLKDRTLDSTADEMLDSSETEGASVTVHGQIEKESISEKSRFSENHYWDSGTPSSSLNSRSIIFQLGDEPHGNDGIFRHKSRHFLAILIVIAILIVLGLAFLGHY